MKKTLLIAMIAVLSTAAWSQGFGKKKAVESAATPSASTTTAPAPKADAKAAKAKKPKGWTGTVCTLVSCASGKMNNPSKADAMKSAANNEILCFCVGKKCYIVLNADGTNASSKLAEKAGGKVTVEGKMMTKNGMSVIMANSIN